MWVFLFFLRLHLNVVYLDCCLERPLKFCARGQCLPRFTLIPARPPRVPQPLHLNPPAPSSPAPRCPQPLGRAVVLPRASPRRGAQRERRGGARWGRGGRGAWSPLWRGWVRRRGPGTRTGRRGSRAAHSQAAFGASASEPLRPLGWGVGAFSGLGPRQHQPMALQESGVRPQASSSRRGLGLSLGQSQPRTAAWTHPFALVVVTSPPGPPPPPQHVVLPKLGGLLTPLAFL